MNEVLIKLRNLNFKRKKNIVTARKFYSGDIAVQIATVKIKIKLEKNKK